VLRADDPLSAEPAVPMAALASRRLVAVAPSYRLRRHIDAALSRARVSPAAVLDTNTSAEAMGAVRAGLGIAVVEPATPASVPLDGLAVRPLDVAIPFFWGVFTPVANPVPPAIQGLIAALRRAARAAIPEIRLHEHPTRELRLNALHGVAADAAKAAHKE
jgi:DNA-binding transcriptional LysR family regulator